MGTILDEEDIIDTLGLISACCQYSRENGINVNYLLSNIICGEGTADETDEEITERMSHIVILKKKGLIAGHVSIQWEFDDTDMNRVTDTVERGLTDVENLHITEEGEKFLKGEKYRGHIKKIFETVASVGGKFIGL